LLNRLAYALIGSILGSLLGLLLWWLYGLGVHPGVGRPALQPDPVEWVKYTGGACAVVGFIFKDRVGDFIGLGVRTAYDIERGTTARREWHAPWWLIAIVMAGVAYAIWRLA
jgi:hypothetical protein